MEGLNPSFAKLVAPGDIIVAGRNFGCGSSREQAVTALKSAGVSAVLAKSFARIFYRNAVNLGLRAMVSDDACEVFVDGDPVDTDWSSHTIISEDGTRKAHIEKMPGHVSAILDSGGLVPHLKARIERGQ